MEYTYRGRAVRIIQQDSDPACEIWVTFEDAPDEDAMVFAADLVAR